MMPNAGLDAWVILGRALWVRITNKHGPQITFRYAPMVRPHTRHQVKERHLSGAAAQVSSPDLECRQRLEDSQVPVEDHPRFGIRCIAKNVAQFLVRSEVSRSRNTPKIVNVRLRLEVLDMPFMLAEAAETSLKPGTDDYPEDWQHGDQEAIHEVSNSPRQGIVTRS
jgi:hypothetical protein